MKTKRWPLVLLVVLSFPAIGQDAVELISAVMQKQSTLKMASYSLERIDTLLTGDVRRMRGNAYIKSDTSDRPFGFMFWAKRDDVASQVIYTGKVAYVTDDSNRTYVLMTRPDQITNVLNYAGGHVLMPDLMKLDTAKAINFSVTRDDQYHYLTVHYADLKEYDVIKRYKTVSIDRKTLLPMAIRKHQESLGKVQDLFYRITSLSLDDAASSYPFSEPEFLGHYSQQLASRSPNSRINTLIGKTASAFELRSLDGSIVSSSSYLGKVILLDFWEVWCGPCVASMPKVQQMQEKYSDEGLQVFGITHEEKQLDAAKRLIARKEILFPTLVGNASTKEFYGLTAIPLYVVIDRKGKIAFVSEGFTPEIGAEVRKAISR